MDVILINLGATIGKVGIIAYFLGGIYVDLNNKEDIKEDVKKDVKEDVKEHVKMYKDVQVQEYIEEDSNRFS